MKDWLVADAYQSQRHPDVDQDDGDEGASDENAVPSTSFIVSQFARPGRCSRLKTVV
jgi:hypothetical protein